MSQLYRELEPPAHRRRLCCAWASGVPGRLTPSPSVDVGVLDLPLETKPRTLVRAAAGSLNGLRSSGRLTAREAELGARHRWGALPHSARVPQRSRARRPLSPWRLPLPLPQGLHCGGWGHAGALGAPREACSAHCTVVTCLCVRVRARVTGQLLPCFEVCACGAG